VDSLDARSGRSIRTYCRAVIMATPRFIAHHLVESSKSERPKWAPEFTYAPWMVANVSLGAMPSKGTGASLSWDNVLFDSPSLGYVVATHQRQAIDQRKTVLSYYLPLSDEKPEVARKRALETSPEAWRDLIFSDLRKAHPEIESQAEAVDIWLWGHAMIRAQPGFIWGKARASALIATGKIHYAHSDMSGISLFEEAQYRGVLAAQAALRDCGGIT
jgi:hypothetical protein